MAEQDMGLFYELRMARQRVLRRAKREQDARSIREDIRWIFATSRPKVCNRNCGPFYRWV